MPSHLDAEQQARADAFMQQFIRGGSPHAVEAPSIEVVNAGARAIQAQINAVVSMPTEELIVLTPTTVVMPARIRPADMYPETIVPQAVSGGREPLSMPSSITTIMPLVGTLLVYLGKEVAAQLAISGVNELVQRAKKKYNIRGIKFRYLTGSVTDRGIQRQMGPDYVKPRDEAGKVPEERPSIWNWENWNWWAPWGPSVNPY